MEREGALSLQVVSVKQMMYGTCRPIADFVTVMQSAIQTAIINNVRKLRRCGGHHPFVNSPPSSWVGPVTDGPPETHHWLKCSSTPRFVAVVPMSGDKCEDALRVRSAGRRRRRAGHSFPLGGATVCGEFYDVVPSVFWQSSDLLAIARAPRASYRPAIDVQLFVTQKLPVVAAEASSARNRGRRFCRGDIMIAYNECSGLGVCFSAKV